MVVALAALVLPIQVATVLLVCGVYLRRGLKEGMRYSGAAVLGFIITGKVLSPQYLIWLMPYVAVLEGPIVAGALDLRGGLTATLLASAGLSFLARTDLAIIVAFNLKNVLFLWLMALLTFGPTASTAQAVPGERG